MHEVDRLKALTAAAPAESAAEAPIVREVTVQFPRNFQVASASDHSQIVLAFDQGLPSNQHLGFTIDAAETVGRELCEIARQQRRELDRRKIAVPRKRLILPH